MEEYIYKKKVDVTIYGGDLTIILTNSYKKIKKIFPNFEHENVFAHSIYPSCGIGGYYIILNFHDKENKVSIGTIAHESTHIANAIFTACGIIVDTDNDEPHAYLVEWVSEMVNRFAKKHNFKIN